MQDSLEQALADGEKLLRQLEENARAREARKARRERAKREERNAALPKLKRSELNELIKKRNAAIQRRLGSVPRLVRYENGLPVYRV